MQPKYQVAWENKLFRFILRPVFRGVFRLLSQVQIEGRENIPWAGAYIIAINHVSLFEPPFVLAFWPHAPEAIGAVDIWQRPGQSLLARCYGGIPVHRDEYDRALLETMLQVLRSERPLVIAPEGGRSHRPGMRRGKPGLAYVVEKANVPVLPVGISGALDNFLNYALRGSRPTIKMRIGKLLYLPAISGQGAARRAARQSNVDFIMEHIAQLLPEEYHGVYRQK